MDWNLIQKRTSSVDFSAMIKGHIRKDGKEALNVPKQLDRIFTNYEVMTKINGKIISNMVPLTPKEMGFLNIIKRIYEH